MIIAHQLSRKLELHPQYICHLLIEYMCSHQRVIIYIFQHLTIVSQLQSLQHFIRGMEQHLQVNIGLRVA